MNSTIFKPNDDDFVEAFNTHRKSTFTPSHRISVDESISRWYRHGGDWIDNGMPHYVALDRKPESGSEIQNSACDNSGILLRLLIVKGAGNITIPYWSDDLFHGTNVLRYLLEPWFGSGQGVCADSYFSSVIAA